MPFKKSNSKYWKIRRKNLPGYGDSGTLSTQVTSKKLAAQMERLLEEIAEWGLADARWHDVLDALKPARRGQCGKITLPDLLKAKQEGTLPLVVSMLQDPLLEEAVEEYAQVERDYRTRNGLSLLLELTPPGARLTYLRQARNIMQICAAAEAGSPQRAPMKRNSVRRTLLNGISKLLRYHLGAAVRNEIFAGVNYAKEKDGREVFLTASELAALLEACRHEEDAEAYPYIRELRTIVRMALVTGADRTPVLDLKVKDVELVTDHQTHRMQGTVHVRDSKNDARPRTVAITHSMCRELRPLVLGKEPGERIFSLDRHQLRYWFDKARDKAGLSHVRFKDLRHQFGIYSEKAGLEHSRIRNAMGHKDDATTLRYKLYEVVLDVDSAERIESAMGLSAVPEKRLVNAS